MTIFGKRCLFMSSLCSKYGHKTQFEYFKALFAVNRFKLLIGFWQWLIKLEISTISKILQESVCYIGTKHTGTNRLRKETTKWRHSCKLLYNIFLIWNFKNDKVLTDRTKNECVIVNVIFFALSTHSSKTLIEGTQGTLLQWWSIR